LQPQKRDADGLGGGSRQQRKRDDDGRTQQLGATVLGSVKKTLLGTKGKKTPEQGQERERRDLKKNRRQRKEN
jgi:hypothetical protein